MKYFKLNIGTKLFILYFIVSSTLVWLFAHRTSIESAKEVMVEVATMFSTIASQNITDDETISLLLEVLFLTTSSHRMVMKDYRIWRSILLIRMAFLS